MDAEKLIKERKLNIHQDPHDILTSQMVEALDEHERKFHGEGHPGDAICFYVDDNPISYKQAAAAVQAMEELEKVSAHGWNAMHDVLYANLDNYRKATDE